MLWHTEQCATRSFTVDDRLGQAIDVLARALEEVEGEALRALGADAGQALELGDERLERFG